MSDWLQRLQARLGGDTPFRATDVKPPRAVVLSGRNAQVILDELEEAQDLADQRRELLEAISQPHSSDATERQVLKRIRQHLRETDRA